VAQFDAIRQEFNRIHIPGVQYQLTLYSAVTITQLMIALGVAWFWLFWREAALSPTFPRAGTIFVVFARTRTSRVMFHAFLTAVPATAAVLAYRAWPESGLGGGFAIGSIVMCASVARMVNWFRDQRSQLN
jgi:hypothetical protein